MKRTLLKITENIKDLGVFIDTNMFFAPHISYLISEIKIDMDFKSDMERISRISLCRK